MTEGGGGRRPGERRPWAAWSSAAVAATALVTACAGGDTPDFRGTGTSRDAPVVVEVENAHFNDVVVYASSDGAGWQRLGSVIGLSSGRLTIPTALHSGSGAYYLRVHAIGAADRYDYLSGAILANPGDVIELRVAGVLRMSSWSVRAED